MKWTSCCPLKSALVLLVSPSLLFRSRRSSSRLSSYSRYRRKSAYPEGSEGDVFVFWVCGWMMMYARMGPRGGGPRESKKPQQGRQKSCSFTHLACRAAAEEELKVTALGRDGSHLLLCWMMHGMDDG